MTNNTNKEFDEMLLEQGNNFAFIHKYFNNVGVRLDKTLTSSFFTYKEFETEIEKKKKDEKKKTVKAKISEVVVKVKDTLYRFDIAQEKFLSEIEEMKK